MYTWVTVAHDNKLETLLLDEFFLMKREHNNTEVRETAAFIRRDVKQSNTRRKR